MKLKALIISIKGTKLSRKEKFLLSKYKPWGIILFKRNIESIKQIKNLTSNIKKITKNNRFPIMIDEEGKNVSRLRNIINHDISANFFGSLFKKNNDLCLKILKHYILSLCMVLKNIGININTIPVLDVLRQNTSKIIGNRSFSKNKKIVKKLGMFITKHLHKNKIISIIKHIPGHGAATVDSHKRTPKVPLSIKKLNEIDFYPFKSSKAKIAMTAHVLYPKLDKNNVATFSKKIIKDVIRKKIRFNGILISDDISMKALKYDLVTNAKKSLDAGCNLVLYCSGNINDNLKLIKTLPYIDKFTSKKTSEFYKFLR
tara:strand:+ start:292 stop:1236 length:945 start_codon:yes stop_codon:yes gene_type:complete